MIYMSHTRSFIRFLLSLLILWFTLTGNYLRAQEKATPPPTRLPAEEDTTRIEEEPAGEKPELELPEVLILGKDRAVRQADSKLSISQTTPSLHRPELNTHTINYPFLKQEEKPSYMYLDRDFQRLIWGSFEGGTYTSLLARGRYWRQTETHSYQFGGYFDHSNGQYYNSQYSNVGFDAHGDFAISPFVNLQFAPRYALNRFGLYGAADTTAIRLSDRGGALVTLRYDSHERSRAEASLELYGQQVHSEFQSSARSSVDLWMESRGQYTAQWSRFSIAGTGRFLAERTSHDGDSLRLNQHLGEAGLEGTLYLLPGVSGVVGARYQHTVPDSTGSSGRVSPYGRINLMPGPEIGLTLKVTTGYEYQTYAELYHRNRYVDHQLMPYPDEVRFGVETRLDLEPVRGMVFSGAIGYNMMDRLYYWRREVPEGLFRRRAVTDVGIAEISLSSVIETLPWLRFEGEIIAYTALYDQDAPFADRNSVPYRPTLRIPLQATVELPYDFRARVDGEFNGARTMALTRGGTLQQYISVGAAVERPIGQYVTAYIEARNIVDHEYSVWEGYPAVGRQWFVGLDVQL